MIVVTHEDPREFRDSVGSLLLKREAENCLGIGIIDTLITDPERYPKFHLFSIRDANEPIAAAWMTAPHPLGFTALPSEAVSVLAEFVQAYSIPVSGIIGPRPSVDEFKELWLARSNCSIASVMGQRIFQLESVIPATRVAGTLRRATESDRSLIEAWSLAFIIDCGLVGDEQSAKTAAEFALRNGSRYLWDVQGNAVSMVGCSGNTPSGIRINWVYTPPSERGRGYASAAVAALSEKLLDAGKKYCFLYTDVDNPTSNRIYQRIGYQHVCDSMHYKFA